MWLFLNSDVYIYDQERWFSFSIPKIYKYKIENHFKYNYSRMVGWVSYIFYTSFITFYVPFHTLNDITGGSEGLISIQG